MPPDALLDLVCGPASPLPETYQRYRLVAHLGSGGQAEVYRAVRLSGGVTSAPVTVKVFRVDPNRPLVDELRSWDKGDAALMDLNNRGVAGICRRADGFYGPPPHRPGEPPLAGNAVPYQIYDYLHGVNLRDYLSQAQATPDGTRLNAVATLRSIAAILNQMHHPEQPGACPVLHMDVKPSNVMVLTDGEVRLIDFTGARYWRSEEITQIAYTPESGGPEALRGEVGPPYDVHGFGAVAYYLVTGAYPRSRHDTVVPGQQPYLKAHPRLRNHLLATLADRPDDRPGTPALPDWVDALAALVRDAGPSGVPVDWTEPTLSLGSTRAVGRARPQVTGTETEAYQRIEKLERALVELRGTVAGAARSGAAAMAAAAAGAGMLGGGGRLLPTSAYAANPAGAGPGGPPNAPSPAAGSRGPTGSPAVPPAGSAPGARNGARSGPPDQRPGPGTPGGAGAAGAKARNAAGGDAAPGQHGAGSPRMQGRAAVVPKPPRSATDTAYDRQPAPAPNPNAWHWPTREEFRLLRRGRGWSTTGALFAFVAWGVWAADNRTGSFQAQLIAFLVVLVVAVGLFAMLRLLGWLVFERIQGRKRRTATGAHLGTAVFLVIVGYTYYLRNTGWLVNVYQWLVTRPGR